MINYRLYMIKINYRDYQVFLRIFYTVRILGKEQTPGIMYLDTMNKHVIVVIVFLRRSSGT